MELIVHHQYAEKVASLQEFNIFDQAASGGIGLSKASVSRISLSMDC